MPVMVNDGCDLADLTNGANALELGAKCLAVGAGRRALELGAGNQAPGAGRWVPGAPEKSKVVTGASFYPLAWTFHELVFVPPFVVFVEHSSKK